MRFDPQKPTKKKRPFHATNIRIKCPPRIAHETPQFSAKCMVRNNSPPLGRPSAQEEEEEAGGRMCRVRTFGFDKYIYI